MRWALDRRSMLWWGKVKERHRVSGRIILNGL